MTTFTESDVEAAALAWLEATGWQIAHGPQKSSGSAIFTHTFHQRNGGYEIRP